MPKNSTGGIQQTVESIYLAESRRVFASLLRLMRELLPEPEVIGLVELMVLQESRREARTTNGGDVILLEDQDRTRRDRRLIEEGQSLVESALTTRRFGAYSLQAAIAAAVVTLESLKADRISTVET
jgi:RNA polymerase sigma-70 factor (ECF subfamily)